MNDSIKSIQIPYYGELRVSGEDICRGCTDAELILDQGHVAAGKPPAVYCTQLGQCRRVLMRIEARKREAAENA